jgi:dipeptidase D
LTDVITLTDQDTTLAALHAAPIGVRRMSPSVPGVVETSNNLGTMHIDTLGLQANLMVRSLVDSAAEALGDEIASLFTLASCEVDVSGHYPGWRPNADSALLARCRDVYANVFGAEYGPSRVQVIHAGLECGIIGGTHPQLDMVSFGPSIRGAHAPGERVEVASVNRCWHLLAAILESLAKHD